eukprot:scaffold161240_cov19-Tisochrysis_lutea.AAC.2
MICVLPVDLPNRGLQTAAAATAAAASAPSSWFARDAFQGGQCASSPPTPLSPSASAAGDASTQNTGASFSLAFGSTCRPSTTHSRSSSDSSDGADSVEEKTKGGMSSGSLQGMKA